MDNAYFFAAKGIQNYILDGGKLKDMAGASELVARLCRSDRDDLLEDVLRAANFTPAGDFSRRAGGVFMLHYAKGQQQNFERFHGLWQLVVSLAAPGLEFVDACWQGLSIEAAREAARNLVAIRQNGVGSLLPMAAPVVQRAQRTGLAAVEVWRQPDEELEALDLVTLAKRKMQQRAEKRQTVTARFEPDKNDLPQNVEPPKDGWRWPVDLERPATDPEKQPADREKRFPFEKDKRWIGVVHADISGLGKLWQGFDGDAAACLRRSEAIEAAMTGAARWASGQVLAPKARDGLMPARPIILGGDDLTILVRANLAIDYAEAFLKKLETLPVEGMTLTACAGIAFIKSSQPFHMASELAEDLCKFAKNHVKAGQDVGGAIPSAIAFHRVTSSLSGRFEDILAQERTAQGCYELSCQPYLVGRFNKPDIAKLSDLKRLHDWMARDGVSIGPLRNLQSLMFTDFADLSDARKGYGRWRAAIRRRLRLNDKEDRIPGFDEPLDALLGMAASKELPFAISPRDDEETKFRSPTFDALDLRELTSKPEDLL